MGERKGALIAKATLPSLSIKQNGISSGKRDERKEKKWVKEKVR